MIIWEVLSWFVVVAFYNVIGDKPGLLRKAICAHIRSAAVASIIGLVLYVLAFCGVHVHSFSNTETRSLAPESNWGFFRLAGVAYEPLFFGFYLGVSIPVTLAVRQFRPNWMPKWQVAGSLLVQSAAMFLTFSAGGWASLLISLTVFTYWTRDRNRRFTAREKGRIAAVVAISAIVMAGLILTIQPLADKIQGTVEKVTGGGDNVRKGEWAVGWGIAQDYPFLGCGPGMANYLFPKYHPTMLSQSMAPGVNEVNNVYLGTLAESGIVGLVALCWCALTGLWVLVAALRRYGYRNAPILAALTASLLGCAIQYMSIGPTTLILIYFVDVAGLALAATRPSPALAAPTSSSIEI
jgi:O-antigen ligase